MKDNDELSKKEKTEIKTKYYGSRIFFITTFQDCFLNRKVNYFFLNSIYDMLGNILAFDIYKAQKKEFLGKMKESLVESKIIKSIEQKLL